MYEVPQTKSKIRNIMEKIEKSEKVFHDWLHKHCKKGQMLRIHSTDKVFLVSTTQLTVKDIFKL